MTRSSHVLRVGIVALLVLTVVSGVAAVDVPARAQAIPIPDEPPVDDGSGGDGGTDEEEEPLTFVAYNVEATAKGITPTRVAFAVGWQCNGATWFELHLYIYSFDDNKKTVWDKTFRGKVKDGQGKGFAYPKLDLKPGRYAATSSNALCWADDYSQGVGPRDLRCWNAFTVKKTRVVMGRSFKGMNCT